MPIIAILFLGLIIYLIYIGKKSNYTPHKKLPSLYDKKENEEIETKPYTYTKKPLLTEIEKKFLIAIKKSAGENYTVQPQVNLATIIQKQGEFKYQNELYRNIDFGIFNEDYECVLLIEINDESHNEPNRKRRDAKVKEICKSAEIPLITFYTKYGVNQKYIDEKVKENIK